MITTHSGYEEVITEVMLMIDYANEDDYKKSLYQQLGELVYKQSLLEEDE